MEKKKVIEVGVVCGLFLLMAWYVESTDYLLDHKNRIPRGTPGEGDTSVNLILNAEDVLEDYSYPLTIEEMGITEVQAKDYFLQARKEIDSSFYAEGDTAEHVTEAVCMKETYADKLVSAEWSLDSYRAVGVDGAIREENLLEEGTLVTANAELACGNYKETYSFAFIVYPREKNRQEKLLDDLGNEISRQQEQEGEEYVTLPEEVNGYQLNWEQTREHLVWKVLFFEIAILILLHFVKQEREREQENKRREQMRLDYSEVVNKLLILLGSGMALKQAWNRISAQYFDKRQKRKAPVRYIYEEMLITSHEISDGASERIAYQNFGERIGLGSYYRLVRILVQNLQTGSRGLCQLLEQETENALEERKALAKKLGEEAGTKLLLPMMLMLGIVIAIIMVPAVLSFNV